MRHLFSAKKLSVEAIVATIGFEDLPGDAVCHVGNDNHRPTKGDDYPHLLHESSPTHGAIVPRLLVMTTDLCLCRHDRREIRNVRGPRFPVDDSPSVPKALDAMHLLLWEFFVLHRFPSRLSRRHVKLIELHVDRRYLESRSRVKAHHP